MANRLAGATSPYLQQHAENPVDWWPWCDEAFAEARRRDVPVLISVGYAACHWCHVMAHESFEDEKVAAEVNALTVPIKVDREERPDVDAVYMAATQAVTGQGGWPMTVFATPDGEPYYCGTYLPRDGFLRLVRAAAQAWREQRDAVTRQGAAVVAALGAFSALDPGGPMTARTLDAAASSLLAGYDAAHGGFDGVPKFPPHMSLLFLLRFYQRTADRRALDAVRHTCERMARGGIYDQLAGGFARYAVDRTWTVPHFEKMLYDNALLLRCYTHLWRLTGDPLASRVAGATADFLTSALFTAEGGFASALDADTEGVEGLTYAWTPAQLVEVLGADDGAWVAEVFGVTEEGTFERGTSVLRLRQDPHDEERFERVRARLREARERRPQPARDGKVVAAWNGLAITALVEYAAVAPGARRGTVRRGAGAQGTGDAEGTGDAGDAEDVHEPDGEGLRTAARFGARAIAAGELLARVHLVGGRLRRVSRDGVAGSPDGVLEDYGCVAEAFCALHQYTADGRWLELAGKLLDVAMERFSDGRGGYFDTADDAERLVSRPADPTDNATPSGRSAMAAALTSYAALTGATRYREPAEAALAVVAPLATTHPRYVGYACAVGEALLSGPYELAIATGNGVGEYLARAAWRRMPPGAVIVAGPPDAPGVPLLAGRTLHGGVSTAYTCRGFVCEAPVNTVDALMARLPGAGAATRRE